jgi:hypothetical protein
MTKVQKKSKNITSFAGTFYVNQEFNPDYALETKHKRNVLKHKQIPLCVRTVFCDF